MRMRLSLGMSKELTTTYVGIEVQSSYNFFFALFNRVKQSKNTQLKNTVSPTGLRKS